MSLAALIAPYVTQLSYLQSANYIVAGTTALFFYDWLLCLEEEITYIWRARLSLGKVLFLLHRYPMMALCVASLIATLRANFSVPSIELCRAINDLSGYGDITLLAAIQATLIVRVYALYRRSPKILVALSILFVVTNATSLVLFSHLRKLIIYSDNPLAPAINFCNTSCPTCIRWTTYTYLPMLLADTIILGLTVSQAYVQGGTQRSVAPTLGILFRDGIFYFSVIFGLVLSNILFMAFLPGAMSQWFVPFIRPIGSSMGTRLLLNLHGQIHLSTHAWRPTTSTGSTSIRLPRDNPSVSIARFPRGSRVPGRLYMDEDSELEMDVVVCSEVVEKSGFHRNSRRVVPVEVYVNETVAVHHEVAPQPRRSVHLV